MQNSSTEGPEGACTAGLHPLSVRPLSVRPLTVRPLSMHPLSVRPLSGKTCTPGSTPFLLHCPTCGPPAPHASCKHPLSQLCTPGPFLPQAKRRGSDGRECAACWHAHRIPRAQPTCSATARSLVASHRIPHTYAACSSLAVKRVDTIAPRLPDAAEARASRRQQARGMCVGVSV